MKRLLPYRIWRVLVCVAITAAPIVAQSIAITSFTPLSGNTGTLVSIAGSGFSATPADNVVHFGPVKAEVAASSTTVITVAVPPGAVYGAISVTCAGRTAFSQRLFDHSYHGIGKIVDGMYLNRVDVPPSNSGANALTLGDFDGDGMSDLAVHFRFGSSLGICRSTGVCDTIGEFQFSSEADYSTGFFPNLLHRSDINNDGRPDIVSIPAMSPFISIFVNNSSKGIINFSPRVDIPSNHLGTKYSAVEDVDGDGKADIILCVRESCAVYIYRNMSTASGVSFGFAGSYTSPPNTNGLLVADLDGDNKPEVITTCGNDNCITVRKNMGYPGVVMFGPEIRFDVQCSTSFIDKIDADGDGRIDLIAGSSENSCVLVIKNISLQGNIAFDTPFLCRLAGIPLCAAIDDVDGDGKPDIIVSTKDSAGIDFLENESAGTVAFSRPSRIVLQSGAYGICSGDINGDGTPEIIATDIARNTIGIYQNMSSRNTVVTSNVGWNLVSLPRLPVDPRATVVFPTAVQALYGFTGSAYVHADTVKVGQGYWAYFNAADSTRIYGLSINSVTQTIQTGGHWTLLGSVTRPAPVQDISAVPASAGVFNSLYGFNGSAYVAPAMIEPGKGYWLYVLQPCTITVGK